MKPGSKNTYVCDMCHAAVVTIDRVEGTTPFMVGHNEIGSSCTGTTRSSFYRPTEAEPTHEWFRPTEADLVAYFDRLLKGADPKFRSVAESAMREHVARGGLIIRPITK